MIHDLEAQIQAFLGGAPHAVVGASQNREKYGNKVLRCFLQHNRPVLPVHPAVTEVEGQPAYPDIASLPVKVHGVSIVTPPAVTERVAAQIVEAGIEHVWMQPGAESDAAVAALEAAGVNCIAGGTCLLVTLGYHETDL